MDTNFRVNERHGSGFYIKFDNGYSVSVQWGPGCYCSNHEAPRDGRNLGSVTAEVAIFYGSSMVDDPLPYRTPEQVAATIYSVSQRGRPHEENREEFEFGEEAS